MVATIFLPLSFIAGVYGKRFVEAFVLLTVVTIRNELYKRLRICCDSVAQLWKWLRRVHALLGIVQCIPDWNGDCLYSQRILHIGVRKGFCTENCVSGRIALIHDDVAACSGVGCVGD